MADFRIHFYENLSTLLSSGLPILRALSILRTHAKFGWKKVVAQIEQDVSRGTELSDTMSRWPRRFSSLDLTMIRVAEQTGQLAEIFKNLADWYTLRRKLKNTVLSGMLYPLFILHLGSLIAPIPSVAMEGSWQLYRLGIVKFLAPFYIPLAAVIAICLIVPKGGIVRRIWDEIFLRIPVIGTAVKCLALGRFSLFFSMMYKAGVPIVTAAPLAAQSCGNQAVFSRLNGGCLAASKGVPMSEGFSQSLDSEFLQLWAVGEDSGELDNTTAKLAEIYLNKAQFRFELIAQWVPKLIYFTIMLYMAFQVIKGFTAIYGGLLNDF